MPEAARIRSDVYKTLESPRRAIQLVEAMGSANPKIAVAIFVNSADLITAQTERVVRIESEVLKGSTNRIQEIKSAIAPDPQGTASILKDSGNIVIAQASFVAGDMSEMSKDASSRIEPVETSGCRSDPEYAVSILIDRPEIVIAWTVRIGGIVTVRYECIAVVPVQTVVGGNPDKSLVVLGNRRRPAVECLAIDRESDKTYVLFVSYREMSHTSR